MFLNLGSKKKVIIGIHGLGNKPSQTVLKSWWKKSILEGLESIGCSNYNFKFELVYWANFLYPSPLNPKIKDKENRLFLEEPYKPSSQTKKEEKDKNFKKRMLDKIERTLDDIFFKEKGIIDYDSIADIFIRKFFKDLDTYYNKDCIVKTKAGVCVSEAIQNTLSETLIRCKNRDILLIAHSMGSIISYDVLTRISPEIKITSLLTIGSPLGLPPIIKKSLEDQNIDFKVNNKPGVPENIQKSWYNFSDLDDRVALIYALNNDYRKNSLGVAPTDIIIKNDYEYNEGKNPHKSFGYLRAEQVAKVICDFLGPKKENIGKSMLNKIKRLVLRKKFTVL